MARLVITLDDPAFSRLVYPYVKSVFEPRRWGATLLHVSGFPATDNGGDRIDQVRRRLERAFLAEAKTLREAGFDCSVCIRFGNDVASEIVRYASETRADVIVMAAQRRTTAGRLFRRSVAQRVLRSIDVPVLVLRCDEQSAGSEDEFPEIDQAAQAIAGVREGDRTGVFLRRGWL